jgi:hypothetical protein
MTCRNGFVRKKSQARKQRKRRKPAVQTPSKRTSVTDSNARQGQDPMTAFPEFVTLAESNHTPAPRPVASSNVIQRLWLAAHRALDVLVPIQAWIAQISWPTFASA